MGVVVELPKIDHMINPLGHQSQGPMRQRLTHFVNLRSKGE